MLETLEYGIPACSAGVLAAAFAFPELFSTRAPVVTHCEYHGSVPSPGFPALGWRRWQIFHQRVGKSLGSPLLTLLSVLGCCESRAVPCFSPIVWWDVCCTSTFRDSLDNTQTHGAKLSLEHSSSLIQAAVPVATQVILLAGFSLFLL